MTVATVDAIARECFRSFTTLPNARLIDDGKVFGVMTDVPLTFFNGIAESRIGGDDIPRVIEAFRERPFRWWTHSPDLEAALIANGMRHVFDSTGMVADLSRLGEVKSDVAIERVADLEVWIDVFLEGFHKPREERQHWLRAYDHCRGSWIHFLGLAGGQPAATTSVLLAGELAGVYHVVTLPPFRGRGIGAAMTLAAMRAGREHGAHTAVLQSSEMGFGVYRRVGFEPVCELRLFDRRL